MTVSITLSPLIKRLLPVVLALVSVVLLMADDCSGSTQANQVEQTSQATQQDIYNQGQPLPNYPYSNYRQSLIQIENQLATGSVTTWTVWESYGGSPEGVCKSQGWPIPVTTQLSNPQQVQSDHSQYGGNVAVGQMDPTGVYTAPSGLGTWILCLDGNGQAHPLYAEGVVTAYPYAVDIQNGHVVQVGEPDGTTVIKPCQYNQTTKKCS